MTATIVMEGLVKQYPNGVRSVDGAPSRHTAWTVSHGRGLSDVQ